jgi:hypothetical protein
MTDFTAAWLALREPSDHRARNAVLRELVCSAFSGREHMTIVDLACGAGSNLRGLAPYLPRSQHWRLVDHNARLLSAARRTLAAWADGVAQEEPLILRRDAHRLEIAFEERDLAAFDGEALAQGADLVTTTAFFDLASKEWIVRFCGKLAERRLPLYAALTYSGEEKWSPPHAADSTMLDAFRRHQMRDKGFGPAAGPHAVAILQQSLEARGYATATAASPWRLNGSDKNLIQALADGSARAVEETTFVGPSTIECWRQSRRKATGCIIGHVDLFAHPV